jgi:predicted GH43/DUF377 family glycosyl hydrolase
MVATPQVLYEEGVFKMWYNAKGFGDGTSVGDYRIGYAESLDGIQWERSPTLPVLGASGRGWDSQMVEYPEVLKLDDRYYLYYCGNEYGSIGYAEGRSTTSATVEMRTGSSATPDSNWTGWNSSAVDSTLENAREYVQIRVTLRSANPAVTPMIQQLALAPV